MKIRIGIVGYGNLGRGVECAVTKSPDMTLVGIFTRRNPESIHPVTETPVYHVDQAQTMRSEIDVMILCGGSANDLAEQTPAFAHDFNVVDSFDTHAKIPEHFAQVDEVCKASGKIGVISVGWDPGLFSLNRLYGQAVLPNGKDDTFWGKGVSQGHSDAVRRIPGVRDAKQYTIPVEAAMEQVKKAKRRRFPHAKNTRANALWLLKRAQIWRPLKRPSGPCRTTLRIMIQPYTLSRRRNWISIMPGTRMAVWFSAPALPA